MASDDFTNFTGTSAACISQPVPLWPGGRANAAKVLVARMVVLGDLIRGAVTSLGRLVAWLRNRHFEYI